MIEAAIFDIDGALIDSVKGHSGRDVWRARPPGMHAGPEAKREPLAIPVTLQTPGQRQQR